MKSSYEDIASEDIEDFVNINEAVNSLMKAVSVLESMNDTKQSISYGNIEYNFPTDGLDFYKATRHFEINLIKKALQLTRGHQTKAAKLLNLKLTTLNSIIKRYNISY